MASPLLLLLYIYTVICRSTTNEQQQAIDTFYDEDSETNWVILSGDVTDEFATQWDEDEKWDKINENLETSKGHYVIRKCQNVFGEEMCLCGFQRMVGVTHNCHRNEAKEYQKQQRLRSAYSMQRTYNPRNIVNANFKDGNEAISNARSIAQMQLNENNLAQRLKNHPLFNRVFNQQQPFQSQQDKTIQIREQQLENELAAAKIEAENDELDVGELEELEDEVDDLIEEEQELEEGQGFVEEGYFDAAEVDDDEMEEDEEDMEEEYDDDIIGALDEEVETQSELIEKQGELIEKLKHENAMKEELIEILQEEDDEEDEEESDYMVEDEYDGNEYDNGLFDDDGIYDDDEESDLSENEEYYDNVDVDEAYDEIYDVDGEYEEESDLYDDEYDEDMESENDLEKREKEAMIADTFWGMEIYSIAFGVLICCCICCYLQKTKCCGYLNPPKRQEFGYAAYGQQQHGFKRVFGAVGDDDEEDDDDHDMNHRNDIQNDSDEAEMLHS